MANGEANEVGNDINPEVRNLWNGVVNDIHEAEDAQNLSWEIGQHSKQINDATFGKFFGSVQRISGKYAYVAVGRLYERPNRRYEIRSIPSLLNFIKTNIATITIKNEEAFRHFLELRKYSRDKIASLRSVELESVIITEVENALPIEGRPDANELSHAWDEIKRVRDKRIAHNEIAEKVDSTYAQMDLLLVFASEVAKLVGSAYLNTTLILDSKQSGRSMERLLKLIVPPGGPYVRR